MIDKIGMCVFNVFNEMGFFNFSFVFWNKVLFEFYNFLNLLKHSCILNTKQFFLVICKTNNYPLCSQT